MKTFHETFDEESSHWHLNTVPEPEPKPDFNSGPSFDLNQAKNITAVEGKEIQLVCKVYNLGNKTVSES